MYAALGRVLTISGRTIRPEAQAGPEAAADAEAAISGFLGKVWPCVCVCMYLCVCVCVCVCVC